MFGQIYNKILSRPIAIISTAQFVLIAIVFWNLLVQANDYMFTNEYDGLKNYFTFTQYIGQESSELGFLHFTQMNYPFGEYVFFTDNTPLLAVPLRWVNEHVVHIEEHAVAIHNYIFLFNLWLTPLLFFMLIRPYAGKQMVLAILLALSFSWINPQVLKLEYGVYNLSLSSILLVLLILFRKIHQLWQQDKQPSKKVYAALFFLLILSAAAHIYYVPIIALALGLFTLAELFLVKKQTGQWPWQSFLGLNISVALGGIVYYVFIQLVDTYASLRRSTASGFDWLEWKFTPEAIFTPIHYNSLYPIIQSCKKPLEIPSESFGFWGNFVWFTIYLSLIYLLVRVFRQRFNWPTFKQLIKRNTFFVALFFVAFFSYATALGTYIKFCFVPLSLDNLFSPFYFLYEHIDLVTQFRCLARFSWMGYWIIVLIVSAAFFKLIRGLDKQNAVFGRVVSLVLITIMFWDVKDAMGFHQSFYKVNVFNEAILDEQFAGIKTIDFDTYQAILTIPATQVGSENYDITIDDQPAWSTYWMQLSVFSGLPQFNCKMSRTAENQAKAQVDLFLNKKVPDLILNNLNEKPILVVYSPSYEQSFDLKVLDYAKPAVENGSQIIKAFEMDTILVDKNVYYLHWDVKNYH